MRHLVTAFQVAGTVALCVVSNRDSCPQLWLPHTDQSELHAMLGPGPVGLNYTLCQLRSLALQHAS